MSRRTLSRRAISPRVTLSCLLLFLMTAAPVAAINGPFRVTDLGGGFWVIWFEAERYDFRDPDTDEFYAVVPDPEASEGFAINRSGGAGGVIRYDFDISEIDGEAGTAYFWGRIINPNNQSDFMLVEGDPGDPDIPRGPPPYPGGSGFPFDVPDDRIFEENTGPPYAWTHFSHEEGHTKELRAGVNSMHIFHRSGNSTVFWDVFAWTNDPVYVPNDLDYELAEVIEEPSCDAPDTHCRGFTVFDPDGNQVPNATSTAGIYTVETDAVDDAGDPITVTVTADNGIDPPVIETAVGVDAMAVQIRLSEGPWSMSVSVDDSPFCDDEAEDARCAALDFEVRAPAECSLLNDGLISGALILGPIDIVTPSGPRCDDSGLLATTDYITDGVVDETNVLIPEGDPLLPDFGGVAGGLGVEFALNPQINPGAVDGELEAWIAPLDFGRRLIDFDDVDRIGPVDDYVVYALSYLENTTDECIDAVIEVGTADSFKLRVNGGLAAVHTECRGIPAFGIGDMVPVRLAPGGNIVVLAFVQGTGPSAIRLALRNPDGTPLVDGRVTTSCNPPDSYPGATVSRSIEPPVHALGDSVEVTLAAIGVSGPTTIVETIPAGYRVDNTGGGTLENGQLRFQIGADTELAYRLVDERCACRVSILGEARTGSVCTAVRGDSELVCEGGLPRVTVSKFGDGTQIWIQAEDWTRRDPDTDDFYTAVCDDGAFGRAVTQLNRNGGRLTHTFDISAAGGLPGTWYFWGRVINPDNRSDYMLVEGDPDDPEIPQDEPFPGGNETPPFVNPDDRVFEETVAPDWGWAGSDRDEGHIKELREGENTMHFFRREGRQTVKWDVFLWTDDPAYTPTDEDFLASTPIDGEPVGVFRRGDADAGGDVIITDAIFILNFLFLGGAAPGCSDAADADDSGDLSITDGVFLLNFLFLGGAPIPPPAADCGVDPSADGLGCETPHDCE